MEDEPLLVTDFNIDTAFKIVWVSFMQINELSYTVAEAKKSTFVDTNLTRSGISFVEGDQYAILHLKQSKTDIELTGAQIILAAIGECAYSVAALRQLFI